MFIRRPFFFRKPIKKDLTRINNQIRAPQVQVVDETGKNLGVLNTLEAIKIAQERGLDLVEIAPTAKPPVCKIVDYGKYKYQQEKKEHKQKAKQKKTEIKGLRIGFNTSSHDLEYKAKQMGEFLAEGHKVRIEIKLRGREKTFGDLAKEKLNNFLKLIPVAYKIEEVPKRNPIGFTITIAKV